MGRGAGAGGRGAGATGMGAGTMGRGAGTTGRGAGSVGRGVGTTGRGAGTMGVSGEDAVIVCMCGEDAKQLTVRKDGPNQGEKKYYHLITISVLSFLRYLWDTENILIYLDYRSNRWKCQSNAMRLEKFARHRYNWIYRSNRHRSNERVLYVLQYQTLTC
jgi:hypothetical protein